ncbi:hypothetical protein TAMYLO_330261 [Tenacibaculum amylolyticum]
MKNVTKILNVLSIIFTIILIVWITQIDYSNLSFNNNISPYFGILAMIMMLIAMQLVKKSLKK